MVTQNLPQRPATQLSSKRMVVVRNLPPKHTVLLPPRTRFNTGYLKGKRYDLL